MKLRKSVALFRSWKIDVSNKIYSGIIRNYAGDTFFFEVKKVYQKVVLGV